VKWAREGKTNLFEEEDGGIWIGGREEMRCLSVAHRFVRFVREVGEKGGGLWQ
jgi:hypothetical protein